MAAASREWDEAISHFKYEGERADSKNTTINPEKAEVDLASWLENASLDDEDDSARETAQMHGREHMTHPRVNPNNIELYRCSWCRNPSAVLRKCSNCETAR